MKPFTKIINKLQKKQPVDDKQTLDGKFRDYQKGRQAAELLIQTCHEGEHFEAFLERLFDTRYNTQNLRKQGKLPSYLCAFHNVLDEQLLKLDTTPSFSGADVGAIKFTTGLIEVKEYRRRDRHDGFGAR